MIAMPMPNEAAMARTAIVPMTRLPFAGPSASITFFPKKHWIRKPINGNPISEDYIAAAPLYDGTWTVPEEHYFVLGDNRNNSYDSHNWGPVPADYVVGKAILVYWPFDNFGLIKHIPLAAYAP